MLKMRLTRMGRKKRPYYRVVVTEHTAPRNGAFLEILGHYDPLATDSELVVKSDRVKHWLEQGAQPTKTVHHLLAAKKIRPRQLHLQSPGHAANVMPGTDVKLTINTAVGSRRASTHDHYCGHVI